jgi:hypothetical protein
VGTPTYNFELPEFGAGSWYEKFFVGLPHSIEVAVGSIAAGVSNLRCTPVLSAYVGTSLCIASSAWVTLSAAPFGSFVGAFQIAKPGRHAYLRGSINFWGPTYTHFASNSEEGAYFFRAVVNPGSIAVALGGPYAFWDSIRVTQDDGHRQAAFAGITSLGPGAYTLTLQHRHALATPQDSGFYMWPGMHALLHGWEVVRG